MSLGPALSLSRPTFGGFVVLGFVWGAVAALVPELKAQIGASDAVFGLTLFASAFGLVTAMWLAPLAERHLGRHALPLAAGAMALAVPLLGLAPGVPAYAAVLVLLGVTSGLTDVLVNARVADLEARHGRPLMNVNHAAFSFAYALSAVVAGIGREAGLPPVLVLGIAAAAGLATLPAFGRPATAPHAAGARHGAPLPGFVVAVCGAIVLVAFLSEAAMESWSALHVERTLGGRAAEGALGPAMLGLTMGIGRTLGQAVAERLSDVRVLRWAAVVAASGAVLAALAPGPAVAWAGFGLAGLGVSVIGPIGIALAGRLVVPEQRTRAIARAAVIGFCGFFVASPAMGILSELGGLRIAFGAIGLFLLTTLPLVALLGRLAPGLAGPLRRAPA
jgi:MFS family permease